MSVGLEDPTSPFGGLVTSGCDSNACVVSVAGVVVITGAIGGDDKTAASVLLVSAATAMLLHASASMHLDVSSQNQSSPT